MKKKFLLRYSAERAQEPVLASVIRETGVLTNILHADMGAKGGEILISFDATEAEVERVVALFERGGVEVEEVKKVIELDSDICFDCGACVSLCPTKALRLTEEYSLELDEDECIYCELCVPACPVRALKVSKF